MRATTLVLAALLVLPSALPAQISKSATPEAQRANRHYAQGWGAMRAEDWATAAKEFQAALDNDPKFTLAYYSLGRAEMGRRDFAKAIAAYTACRDLYVSGGGERYSNQVHGTRRLEDQILHYRTALRQAQQTSGVTSTTQSQSLYVRELQAKLDRLEQARDRNINLTLDTAVPYFVPMALGAAYFRSGRFTDAEREYKAAIAANASSGETHSNLAVLYLTTGRLDAADSAVRAAEKSGFKVNENLKNDIRKKKGGA